MIGQQWLFYKSTLDGEWCDNFVNYALKNYTSTDATIGFKEESTKSDYRECDIRWLNKSKEKNLISLIWEYVDAANRDSFDVDVRYINDLQFTSYYGESSGRYGWHHDVDFKNSLPHHRKLSVTIQLSDLSLIHISEPTRPY